jgi:hypothetical protein
MAERERWKAIQFNYDFLLTLLGEQCMYCLSPVTVQLCISMLEMAGWKTRYFSPDDNPIDPDIVQQWADTAQRELMENDCISATGVNYLVQTDITNLYQQWLTATTNTDINIYSPITTFNSTSGETSDQDAFRLSALCYACQYYVDTACDAIKQTIGSGVNLANLIGSALAIIAVIAAPFSGGASIAVAAALLSACTFLGANAFNFLTAEILDDGDARKEVACALFTQLTGLTPDDTNFYAQAGAILTTGTNAGLIADGIALLIGDAGSRKNQFNAFINVLGEGFVLAQAGVLPECECCPVTDTLWDWYNTTDDLTGWSVGSTSDIDPSLVTACNDALATYHMALQINPDGMGHNFVANNAPFGGFLSDHYAITMYHDFDTGDCALAKMEIFSAVADSSSSSVKIWVHDAGGWHYAAGIDITGTGGTPTTHSVSFHEVAIDKVAILTYSGTNVYLGKLKLTTS